MARQRISRRQSRGQGLVEFSLVIPLFLLMLFGIIDLGRVIWANDVLANAAREGARYASVHGGSDLVGHTTATPQQIKDYTLTNFSWAGGTSISVTVCYSSVQIAPGTTGTVANCTGDANEPNATNNRGGLVSVTVTSTVPILTGSLLGMGDFGVSGTSTVLINN